MFQCNPMERIIPIYKIIMKSVISNLNYCFQVSSDIILKTASTYEVLRHYRLLLRLSPFRFEDFCAALAAEEQSNLLSEIHIALLKSIVRAEEKDNTTFAPLDQKDSVNCLFFFMDSLSWPDCLRAFLSADPVIHAEPLQVTARYIFRANHVTQLSKLIKRIVCFLCTYL